MRKSARYLGKDIGLSAQEMNVLLKEEGYLEGEPNDYKVTEKGRPYVKQRHWDAGNSLNAGYVVTSWDEEILDEIGPLTLERRKSLADKVAEHRSEKRQQAQERPTAPAKEDADDDGEEDDYSYTYGKYDEEDDQNDGKALGLIIFAVAAAGYLA